MINLDFEHNKKISTQDIYNIISKSLEVADDDGLVNSFIFQRALYAFAAATVYEDLTDDILTKMPNFPELWDELIEKNVIDNLKNDYPQEIAALCEIGATWFDEYDKHIHSSYAVVNSVSNMIQNFTSNFQNRVDDLEKNGDIAKILETATQWGITNNQLQ